MEQLCFLKDYYTLNTDNEINNVVTVNFQKNKTVKFIDLFAGLGGIRLAFEQAFHKKGINTECVLTSEIKSSAIKALKFNHTHKNLVGDIREVEAEEIEDFDFLLGGFPCQSFSTAGKGLGFADTRGTLFFEIARILKAKQPYGFILENVEGLIKHNLKNKDDEIGETFSTILNILDELGYKVSWKLIDSKEFGVAQSRKRVYIVGTKKHIVNLDNFEKRYKVFNEIMEHNMPTINSKFTTALLKHFKPEELYGKSIKDKRGGENNIHSWQLELKGKISKEEVQLLNSILLERRKRIWADEIGIDWMDGMPLTEKQISSFFPSKKLSSMLEDLASKKYLVKEYPKKVVIEKAIDGSISKKREPDTTKEIGYNIVAGKLSFEFSKILDINDVAPTLVAMDVSKLGVVDNERNSKTYHKRRLTIIWISRELFFRYVF